MGARFAKDRALFTTELGDELTWGAALALRLVERRVGGLAAIVEGAGGVGAAAGTRPAELRGALRVALGPVALDAGAGGGARRGSRRARLARLPGGARHHGPYALSGPVLG